MTQSTRPTYRFADNASSSVANEYGNYILKRGAGEIRKPSWNRTDTVIRILPYWDGSQWSPFRLSPVPMDFGDWIRRYDAVRGFGETGVTMLLYDPVTNLAYDIQSNPCVVLYRAIQNSINNKQCEPDWPSLLKGSPGKRALLSRHSPIYLVRCGIFRIKSKDMATKDRSPLGLAAGDPCFFMEIPKTAGEKLIALLEERNEEFSGDPDDYDDAYKYGDIVSLDKGSYVTIFEEGSDPRLNVQVQPGSAPRQLMVSSSGRGNYGGGGEKSGFTGYDMYIEKTWQGFGANLDSPEFEKLIKNKQKTWEDSLQFLSHQEQAFLVQDGFPAKAITYAWRDHPEWIKDETRSKAVGRVSVAMDTGYRSEEDMQPVRDQGPRLPLITPPKVKAQKGGMEDKKEQAVNVGGWGEKPATDGEQDSVVPQSLPEALETTTTPDQPPTTTQARALAALEEARKRAANRNP